jgi:hypothetical protein
MNLAKGADGNFNALASSMSRFSVYSAAAAAVAFVAWQTYLEDTEQKTQLFQLALERQSAAILESGESWDVVSGKLEALKKKFEDVKASSKGWAGAGSELATAAAQMRDWVASYIPMVDLVGKAKDKAASGGVPDPRSFIQWAGDQTALGIRKVRHKMFGDRDSSATIAEQVAAQKRRNEEMIAEAKKAAEETKKIEASIAQEREAAAKQAEQEMDRLRNKAESLRLSMRTPWQVMMEGINEARELMRKNILDLETYGRVVDKLSEDYMRATAAKKTFERPERIEAAVVGTSAGFSAVAEARASQKLMREQLEEETRQRAELERIRAAIKESKLTLPVARF